MNYSKQPLIIEGVNHSGTRLFVDILSKLGSYSGDVKNHWRENKFFLGLHRNLIGKISDKGWTKTILDCDFIEAHQDNFEFYDENQNPIYVPPSKQWIHILPLEQGEVIWSSS